MGLKALERRANAPTPRPTAGYPDGRGTWLPFGGSGLSDLSSKSPDTVTTYFACKRNIAQDLASLPFKLLRREMVNNRPSRTPLENDPLDYLLCYAPNPTMNAFKFWETMFFHRSGGNAFAEIVPNRGGTKVKELWPIHPSRCPAGAQVDKNGDVFYEVYQPDGTVSKYPAWRMFHLMNTSPDGLNGFSVAQIMASNLYEANAASRFAAFSMKNMARPHMILTTDEFLSDQARTALKSQMNEIYAGPENAGKTLVADQGMKVTGFAVSAHEIELIQQRQFTDEQFARAFRMPLRMLQIIKTAQGWSTLSGEESDYVNSCLSPIAKDTELQIRIKLMPLASYPLNIDPHFEFKGRLKGDLKERGEFFKVLFFMGAITPNEIRAAEDMNPIDDPAMDATYIQGATIPLNMAQRVAANMAQPKVTGLSGDNQNSSTSQTVALPAPIEARLLNGVHK